MRQDSAAPGNASGARSAALRTRLDSFRATRRRGALGLPEFAAVAIAALLLLTAIMAYLFLLVPARSRRESLKIERGDMERMLQSQRTNIGEGKDTQQRAADILSSLERFEIDHLGLASSGTKTVVEELNRLILKNNLRISGGVNFRQLQETAPGPEGAPRARRSTSSGDETGQRIEQSVFPGIGVTLTVEGTYPNLRRFIRDIEADRQFVVVNTVELEGTTDSNAAGAPAPVVPGPEGVAAPQPQTPSRNALVSLRLDMAAYFRRAAAAAAPAQ
ncbi:MAG TPA: GspMb/PilO family protein [Pyrinomonadaceae bacterium]